MPYASPVVEAKAAMRVAALAARESLGAPARGVAGARIVRRVIDMAAFDAAHVVMAYASFGTEIDTSAVLAETLARGKTLVLPRIDRARDELALFAVRDPARDLVANRWGIREPRPGACDCVSPASLDFVLAPGVAFDACGARLGYGKGYYDRLFHACARERAMPFAVAGAFDAQLFDAVPMEPHDVRVHAIATESRAIDCYNGHTR